MKTLPHFVVRPTLTRLCSNFDSEIDNYAHKRILDSLKRFEFCPSCSVFHKKLNWFNMTCGDFAQRCVEQMCIKHFCQMVLIPVLYYCQHTVMLLLYMFMVATLDVTLVWYLHICLGLETFSMCWLRHWPNTGSTDLKQIADTWVFKKMHILFKHREQNVLSNILKGGKCSHVYNSGCRPFDL